MPLPPMKISDSVQKAAYDHLAGGAMKKFGDALAVIAERIVNPRRKSPQELAFDWQKGEEESENRRRLAAEALDRVPPARRIFPAPQIAGVIFRDSEFELPGTPIWEMWKELLVRACDKDLLNEVHPSFPRIISQLSPDEAMLLSAFAKLEPHPEPWTGPYPTLTTAEIGLVFPDNLSFYLAHLGSLGMLVMPFGFAPTGSAVQIDDTITYMLNSFGRSFTAAVTPLSGVNE